MENTAKQQLINYNDQPDTDVIDAVLKGSKDLYEIIMRRYNQRLFRISRSIINDEDEIQDILQASYIKAYENLKSFEGRSAFSTWLTRIVINETLARKNKSNRLSYIRQNENEDNFQIHSMTSQILNPEEETSNKELKEALENVIDMLPEKYRAVFVMREIEGLSISETSEALDLSESNVKVRLNRAKSMLKNSLVDIYKETEVFSFLGSRCDSIVMHVMSAIK